MSGKLSEKFAQMKKKATGAAPKNNRVQQRQTQQANARANLQQAARGVAAVANPKGKTQKKGNHHDFP